MVEDLYIVMGKTTVVFLRARLFLSDVLAYLTSVSAQLSAPISGLVVIIRTPFLIVVAFAIIGALGCLEEVQIKKLAHRFYLLCLLRLRLHRLGFTVSNEVDRWLFLFLLADAASNRSGCVELRFYACSITAFHWFSLL
jgi:hypothetical protein